ncbi:hypothetical protein, partial [Rhodococcus ruber]|uniref:hypothetical protein n=1 Tax=Rhodococcus ruber TaxID=1830 RepID=UPI00387DD3C6
RGPHRCRPRVLHRCRPRRQGPVRAAVGRDHRRGQPRRRRAAALARDLAGIAAGPRARDVIEAALDDLLGTA